MDVSAWTTVAAAERHTSPSSLLACLAALVDDQTVLLSAGQKRRLALTRLLIAHRPLWLLDEPTVGLDTASLLMLQNHMGAHLKNGGMIVAATHIALGIKATRQLDLGKVS